MQLCNNFENNLVGIVGLDHFRRCRVAQAAHSPGVPLLQVFRTLFVPTQAHFAACRIIPAPILTTPTTSAVSLLLAVQLYVAQILSTDPSHLENAASDAYVGSRVRRALQHLHACHDHFLISINRTVSIASWA